LEKRINLEREYRRGAQSPAHRDLTKYRLDDVSRRLAAQAAQIVGSRQFHEDLLRAIVTIDMQFGASFGDNNICRLSTYPYRLHSFRRSHYKSAIASRSVAALSQTKSRDIRAKPETARTG
jgi:hypothetical protein